MLRSICNSIKPQEVARTMHLVCKAWNTLLPNEGILDLGNSKIKGKGLSRLIENYIVGAKLHSLDLSQCDHVGDEEMAYLGGFPSTRLNLQLQEKYQKNFRLEKLKISNCRQITEWGIKQLSTLSLTHLDLSSNLWMTDKAVGYLTALPLKHLSLFWCMNITNEGLKTLARSSNLTSLNLDRCNATNATLNALSKLNLVDLDLSLCDKITDAGLKSLSKLNLVDLNLGLCGKITDAGLKPLLKTSLQTLCLHGDQITDSTLQDLSSCPQLTELDLTSCPKISDIGLKAIAKCPLKRLELSECYQLSSKGIGHLANSISLTYLNLEFCSDIDDSLKMLSSLPLTTLHLGYTLISDQGMQDLAKCSSLTSLRLNGCRKITDEGINAISHLNLRKLGLTQCKISDLSLRHLAGCSSLTWLSLFGCKKIADEGIKAIRHNKLTHLDLTQCHISDRCFEDLAGLPLKELSVFKCSQITKKACESLKARFSDRQINFHGIS